MFILLRGYPIVDRGANTVFSACYASAAKTGIRGTSFPMIRLNLSTDYALRLLLYLASHPDRQVATREMVEFHGISGDHVSKVVQHLVHAGYVRSGRGRTGGLQLGRPAAEITVGEVVELFEGPVSLLDCVAVQGVCVIQPECRLRVVLAQAGSQLMRTLNGVTLAELAAPPGPSLVPLTLSARLNPGSGTEPYAEGDL
jgi:Rrf2 family transcriptional regulator, nitric oxide-sensitive transcriptional repressor